MGLIKAISGAAGGVLADQWKEYFYCDSIPEDVLAVKGVKRTSGRSSNTKGTDNIITSGSVIAVADGQCMIIVEQGAIVEMSSEPGEFVFDSSTEPSIFAGNLGAGIIDSFKMLAKRFTFGGEAPKDQRVYYFNTKEIPNNKFGTPTPVPFRVVVSEEMGFKLSVDLRCFGEFSYRIENPILFYKNVCGNVESSFKRDKIDSTMKSELLNALQPALAKIAALKIQYYEIPAHTVEVTNALNEVLTATWKERRGIEVFSMNINSISIPDDQRKKITEWEENVMTMNPNVAASRLVGAQAQAMQDAAKNQGGMGAMGAFMAMNMAQNTGGMNGANLFQMGQQQQMQQQQMQQQQAGWNCSCGQVGNTGRFCSSCGKPKPSDDGWSCSCGEVNKGKFCSSCGKPKPLGVPQYRCDKCGWEPSDPTKAPKFCPECGDPFDDGDIVNK